MGSRAIVLSCRDEATARERFGVESGESGAIYTRTGRPFFDGREKTEAALARVRGAAEAAGLWGELDSNWLLLDCELLPWSAKAGELIRRQYASVGSAARAGLGGAIATLERAADRGLEVGDVLEAERRRLDHVERYTEAYRRYVWSVGSVEDLRLAPFHVLAAEGAVFVDRDHSWHLRLCDRLVEAGGGWLRRTDRRLVDLDDAEAVAAATAWWEEMTAAGGEGMVVKPFEFVAPGRKGIAQPGIKCRGPEYLRIIYGPEYLEPGQLERLRDRNLGRKRSLAVREFALGVEALERLSRGEPLYRVHECVFAVLALESEPVDPRL